MGGPARPTARLTPRREPGFGVPPRASAARAGTSTAAPPWQRARRSARRWAASGVLCGALGALVAFAPASWLAAALAARTGQRLLLTDARGTVWNGSAVAVLSGGADSRSAALLPGRVHWRLAPSGRALELRVLQPCCMADAALLQLRPGLDFGLNRLSLQLLPGRGSADHSLGEWPAAWLAGLGAPWNSLRLGGTLRLSSPGLTLHIAAGRWALAGQAELRLSDMASPLTSLDRLGSYLVRLDAGDDSAGGAGGDGTPTFALSTLDGALQLDGNGQWTGSHWRFRGQARAAPGAEAELDNLLNFLGRRQGALSLISIG